MRMYTLGGANVAEARLSDELAGCTSTPELSTALTDLVTANLVIAKGRQFTFTSEGWRQARKWLDIVALTNADLVARATPASRFLRYFDRPRQNDEEGPSRWQLTVLEWKWLFRRRWNDLNYR